MKMKYPVLPGITLTAGALLGGQAVNHVVTNQMEWISKIVCVCVWGGGVDIGCGWRKIKKPYFFFNP